MQRAVTTLSKRHQAVGLLSLVVAIILMGISYTMPSVRATSATTSTSATVTVSASCALTGTVNTEHTATINNGGCASSAIGSTRYETATNSICPKGWHLPQGPNGTNGSEFETMLKVAGIANPNNTDNGSGSAVNVGYIGGTTLSNTDMEKSPYYFARSGYVSDTTLYSFTSYGYYWSGSVVSSSNAFYLDYDSSALYPTSQNNRNVGRSLRCIAR